MSFERTRGSITNLSGGNISADDLLDMLVCVTRDVYDENNITTPAALRVTDQTVLLKKMYNLMKMILVIYDGNKDGIGQFSERIRGEYSQAAQCLATHETELAGILHDITQQELARTQLTDAVAETETRRAHLLAVKEEYEAMQRRLDQLNDSALDEMAAEKASLEAELAQRSAQADTLTAGLAGLRAQLEEMNTAVRAARANWEELSAETTAAAEEKARLEAGSEGLRIQLEETRRSLASLPGISEDVQAEYREVQMQMTVMRNALNSARSDAFLAENLYTLSGPGGALTVENYPDLAIAGKKIYTWNELEAWFAELNARINGLLNVQQTAIAALVKQAESITSGSDRQ